MFLEFAAQFTVVEDFAVEDDPVALRFIRHRLVTAGDVDDA